MPAVRLLALFAILPVVCCTAQGTPGRPEIAPPSSQAVRRWTLGSATEPILSHDAKLKLLREKVKYVFVLFQENRSFDFYFATYPGADGLYSHASAPGNGQPAGFVQPIVNVDG